MTITPEQIAKYRKTCEKKRRAERHKLRGQQIVVFSINKYTKCVFNSPTGKNACHEELEAHHIHVQELYEIGYYPRKKGYTHKKPLPRYYHGKDLWEKMPLCSKHHVQYHAMLNALCNRKTPFYRRNDKRRTILPNRRTTASYRKRINALSYKKKEEQTISAFVSILGKSEVAYRFLLMRAELEQEEKLDSIFAYFEQMENEIKKIEVGKNAKKT